MGAGAFAGIPTMTQINKLKSKVADLQEIIEKQTAKSETEASEFESKIHNFKNRSVEISKKWQDICDEKPETTYQKWKEHHEKQIAAIKAAKEAELKKQQLLPNSEPDNKPDQNGDEKMDDKE